MGKIPVHGAILVRKARERHRYEMRRDPKLAGLAGPSLVLPSGCVALLLEDGTTPVYEVVAVTGYRVDYVSRDSRWTMNAAFNALDKFDLAVSAVRAAKSKTDSTSSPQCQSPPSSGHAMAALSRGGAVSSD